MTPLRSLLTIASSDEAMIAASSAAGSICGGAMMHKNSTSSGWPGWSAVDGLAWRGFCFDGTIRSQLSERRRMAEIKRSDKQLKKNSRGPREVRDEIADQIRSSGTKPRLQDPNRDRARGDWDRTGDHHDEGMSREEES